MWKSFVSSPIARAPHLASDRRFGARSYVIRAILSAAGRATAELVVRSAVQQLQRLDDRTLKDIGFHRSEIQSIVRDRTGERRQSLI